MWCISAYAYIFLGEAKTTTIFAFYLQVSGFPSLPSKYAFECYREQLGQYDISLSYTSPDVDLVAFFVTCDCHRVVCVDFLQEFDIHVYSPLFLMGDQYCFSLHWNEGFLVVDAEWNVLFYVLLQLVYDVDVVCRWVSVSQSSLRQNRLTKMSGVGHKIAI